ncbi:MAG: hypothetical protein Kow006_22330 [Gammaproteobacteria bacterium]
MDLERWTDIEVLDCPAVGFRVATAIAMTGVRNPEPGPEYLSVYGTLQHCTGALRCSLTLPATVGDLVFSECPVLDLLRERLDESGEFRKAASG